MKKVILLILIISFSLVSCEVENKYYNASFKEQIISLKAEKNITGSFVLGTGSINETDYYYFFIKDTIFDGYKKPKIQAFNTLIVEKDTIPTFIKNKVLKVKTTSYLFGKDKVEKEYSDYGIMQILTGIKIPKKVKYINTLIVPPGVITKNVKWEAL